MEQLKEDLKARYVSPFEDSEDICKKINKNMDIVFDDFIDRCRKFQNEDVLRYIPILWNSGTVILQQF